MSSQVGALTITTRELPDPGALLSWLPTPQGTLSWVSGGDGLVGWGEAARFAPRGRSRFAQAQRWWSQFTAAARRGELDDHRGRLGAGPSPSCTGRFRFGRA